MNKWLILIYFLLSIVYADDENAIIALKKYQVLKSDNFDIHFSVESLENEARKAGRVLESAYREFHAKLGLTLPENNRISVVLYESQGSFRRSSIKSSFGKRSNLGFSEPIKKRIVLWVSPSERDNIYQLRLNLAQMLVFHRLFPEADYTIFLRFTYSEWLITGIPIYLAGTDYDPVAKAFFIDALFHDRLRPLVQLKAVDHLNPHELRPSYQYMAEVFHYIETVHGLKKVRQLLDGMKFTPTDCVLQKVLGMDENVLHEKIVSYLKIKWQKEYREKSFSPEKVTSYDTYYQRFDFSPSLSRDSNTLIFLSDRRDNVELYKMDMRSKSTKRLLAISQGWTIDDLEGLDFPLTCSPNGKFAVVKAKDGFRIQLFLINLSPFCEDKALNLDFDDYAGVSFAPDGKSFVFIGINSGLSQLYRYHFGSQKTEQLTYDSYAKLQPSFSPDGTLITYIAEVGVERDIFVLDLKTKKQQRLKNEGADESYPIFTKDNKIIFTINNNQFINIGRTDIEGNTWEILTDVPGAIFSPCLSYDNQWLYFSYYKNGQMRLYRLPYKSMKVKSEFVEKKTYAIATLPPDASNSWQVSEYEADTSTDYIFPFLAVNVLRFSDIVGAHQVQTQFGVISGAALDPNNAGSSVDVDLGVQGSVNYTFANFLTFSLFGGVELADDDDNDDDDDDNDDDNGDFDYFAGTEIFTRFDITPRLQITTGYTLVYQKTSDDDFDDDEFWSGGIFIQFDISNRYKRGLDITHGYSAKLRTSFFESFFGSDDSYQLVEFDIKYYWSFYEDHIIKLQFEADIGTAGFPGLFDLGGADNMRGVSDDDLEDKERWIATMEYRFPIYRDLNYYFLGVVKDLRGLVFAHVGSVSEDVISRFENYDELDFAVSVGVGLRLDCYFLEHFPLPLSVQVAQRLDENDSPIVYFVLDK